jgi:cation-transporting P-type ATPase E
LSSHSLTTGLTAVEVTARVKRGESNNFQARVGRSNWQIIRDNVLNLFNIVFSILLIIVILMHDYSTAAFAGFSVVTNSILGTVQEISAKRKLDQLSKRAAKNIPVYRDGQLTSVPSAQLVKDDVIPLEPGDRVVVDGRVLQSDALEIDESQLTGESDAIFKEEGSEVYSGSFCIAGSGLMVATRVGRESTINNLSTIAKVYKNVQTPIQHRISALVEVTVLIMLIVMPMLFLAGYLTNVSMLDIVRSMVVFASSIVPQGLVLTAILSLTIGAVSITRFQTLVQRVNAVESMSNVTVLCFDKTGTLTQNQLAVTEILPLNGCALDDIQGRLQRYTGSLAHRNSTALAVVDYLQTQPLNGRSDSTKVREIAFNSSRKWGAVIFNEETLIMGAPERLLDSQQEAAQRASALAATGLRVLAFARAEDAPTDGYLVGHCEPLALIILSDQIRPDIQETLESFRRQNVQLKVISGDNLETVKSIAVASGIEVAQTYTGSQLEAMSESELESAALNGNLFARVEPDTKRRIIAALKRQGHYVAMVGDGVNDVPALKEAHLAIAMNDGAQISKDVAEIVLLNNAMSTLPKAFEEGKAITQAIYGTTKLFLAKNFYNIVLILFVGFMTLPFPTSPIQISWITFGTVNIPATLIAFKLIRPAHMAKFRRDVLEYVIIAGMIGAVNLAVMYAGVFFSTTSSDATDSARSAVTLFIALYGTLIYWNVHGVELFEPRTMLHGWRITLSGLVLMFLTMLAPFILPDLFEFVPPTLLVWELIIAVFFLTAILVYVFTRNRHLIEQFWELLKP